MVVLILIFLKKLHTGFHSGNASLHTHQQHRVAFSLHPYQYLLFLIFVYNSHSNECDVWIYWTSLHICVSHLHVSFGKVYSSPMSIFYSDGFFLLLISCMSFLYILVINSISERWFANIFSHYRLPFHFIDGYIFCAVFKFDIVLLVCFCFSCLHFWSNIQKIVAKTNFFGLLLYVF